MLREEDQLRRLRMPRDGEVFGKVTQMLGASKLMVRCKDNRMRLCRIPGKMKWRIWIKEGDVVIVKPWNVQANEKGDIVWRYTKSQVDRLVNQGVI